jgi:hypothetical protein
VIALLLSAPAQTLPPTLTCLQLNGLPVYSAPPERRYLGFLGSAAARDSIFNRNGPYGSPVGGESIRDRFSPFGSVLSPQSVRSFFASAPPQLPPKIPVSVNPLNVFAVSLSELGACRFTALAVLSGEDDRDGDGVRDAEDAFPLNPQEALDTDGDGIGNREDRDDDNDGLADSEEEAQGTDPRNADSDGDGFWDGDEVAWDTNPLDVRSSPIDTRASMLPIWIRALMDKKK